jgi:hypothetical protein
MHKILLHFWAMKKIVLFLISLLPVVSFARLGETESNLQQRFGEPTSRQTQRIIAQGKFIDLCPMLRFKQDDWSITCYLIDGRSSKENYSKQGEWTDEQIEFVITTNAQGAIWTPMKSSSPKLRREWKRADGATAIWQLGAGLTLTHPAYVRAEEQAKAKAKADASRLPKL